MDEFPLSSVVMPNMAPPLQYGPPQTPQEFEQRKAGWMNVLDKIQNDPRARTLALVVGARLLQGRKPGQSVGGVIGDAAMLGLTADQMMQYNEDRRKLLERELQRKEEEAKSIADWRKAETERVQQATEFARKTEPFKVQREELSARTAALNLRKAELAQLVQDAIARQDPDGEKRARMALARTEQELQNMRAQGAAQWAAAQERKQRTSLREKLANPSTPPEEAGAAMRALGYAIGSGGGGAGDSATVQAAKYYKELWKSANPMQPGESSEDYEKRASAATQTYMTQSKSKSDFTELINFLTATGVSLTNEAQLRKAIDAYNRLRKSANLPPLDIQEAAPPPMAIPPGFTVREVPPIPREVSGKIGK